MVGNYSSMVKKREQLEKGMCNWYMCVSSMILASCVYKQMRHYWTLTLNLGQVKSLYNIHTLLLHSYLPPLHMPNNDTWYAALLDSTVEAETGNSDTTDATDKSAKSGASMGKGISANMGRMCSQSSSCLHSRHFA